MVYLRVPTPVFYIIRAIGFSTLQHSASACQHFNLGVLQQGWVSGLDDFGRTCERGGDSWARRLLILTVVFTSTDLRPGSSGGQTIRRHHQE
jgi:hypothetical protein